MTGADRRSKWKFPVLFFGALLGLAALFQLVETLIPASPNASTPQLSSETPEQSDAESEEGPWKPIRPTLTRTDDKSILIELGFMRRSRYRFDADDDVEEVDAFYACLEKTFEETFSAAEWNSPDSSAAERSALRRRMKRIVREQRDRCLEATIHAPPPPAAPQPPSEP